jgi:hypothetical protein
MRENKDIIQLLGVIYYEYTLTNQWFLGMLKILKKLRVPFTGALPQTPHPFFLR